MARVNILHADFGNLQAELYTTKAELTSSKTALEAMTAERDAARLEAGSKSQLLDEALARQEELSLEKDDLESKLDDAAFYFFVKGKVAAVSEPVEARDSWDPKAEMALATAKYPDLHCEDQEVSSPGGQAAVGEEAREESETASDVKQ